MSKRETQRGLNGWLVFAFSFTLFLAAFFVCAAIVLLVIRGDLSPGSGVAVSAVAIVLFAFLMTYSIKSLENITEAFSWLFGRRR